MTIEGIIKTPISKVLFKSTTFTIIPRATDVV